VNLRARLNDPAMRVRGVEMDVAALLLAGTAAGRWPRFVDRVSRGVGLERDSVDLPDEDVRARVRKQRRRAGLLSRTELRSWLAVRRMTSDDLVGVARRAVLADRAAEVPVDAPDLVAVQEALWPELACAGALRDLGRPLALGLVAEDRVGAAPAPPAALVDGVVAWARGDMASGLATLPAGELRPRAERACALVAHGRRLVDDAAAPAAVEARLRERELEWRAVVVDELRLPHEGAAREACTQARLEGRGLGELADAHGFRHRRRRLRVEEYEVAVRGQLIAARAGDVIGPVRTGGDDPFLVVAVERVAAADDGDELERRAAAELEDEAIARATAGAVSWIEPY
jgi:hypothetical protein